MSRSNNRNDRLATTARVRPKRRASSNNYLFKYQLACDPSRIEENALRKALQESLEEHKSMSPMTAGAAVIANSKQQNTGKSKIKSTKQNHVSNDIKSNSKRKHHQNHHHQNQQQQQGSATKNSSTNSSDVSRASNTSSSSTTATTNSSSKIYRNTSSTSSNGGDTGNSKKRLRSSATLPNNSTSSNTKTYNNSNTTTTTTTTTTNNNTNHNHSNTSKRAKLTINGHSNNIDRSPRDSLNKCDNDDTSVLAWSPTPTINRSVHKTYSRSQQANQGLKNNTIDLSKIQNQASVNLSKKRIAQGSWSLLGVPEEKQLFLRNDEHPTRLICYPAIKHVEGDVIQVRDSVLLRSGAKKTDLPYIAKVCAFWEDAETGGVMMSLFWYYRPEHIEEGRKPHHLVDEIFASRHRDVDSVECIEDKCYVLTFNEYCRYRKRCKMEQVNTTWSLADVTIPVSNESYPRRNRIPDSNVNPELVFCCRQIYDSRYRRLIKNPHLNPKYGHI